MDRNTDIDVVNDLITGVLDSVDGYRQARRAVADQELAETFHAIEERREDIARRMQSLVTGWGGEPRDDGSLGGSAHRWFMRLREVVSGNDGDAIFQEVERGESHLAEQFDDAVAKSDLNDEVRATIANIAGEVRQDRDKLSALNRAV